MRPDDGIETVIIRAADPGDFDGGDGPREGPTYQPGAAAAAGVAMLDRAVERRRAERAEAARAEAERATGANGWRVAAAGLNSTGPGVVALTLVSSDPAAVGGHAAPADKAVNELVAKVRGEVESETGPGVRELADRLGTARREAADAKGQADDLHRQWTQAVADGSDVLGIEKKLVAARTKAELVAERVAIVERSHASAVENAAALARDRLSSALSEIRGQAERDQADAHRRLAEVAGPIVSEAMRHRAILHRASAALADVDALMRRPAASAPSPTAAAGAAVLEPPGFDLFDLEEREALTIVRAGLDILSGTTDGNEALEAEVGSRLSAVELATGYSVLPHDDITPPAAAVRLARLRKRMEDVIATARSARRANPQGRRRHVAA